MKRLISTGIDSTKSMPFKSGSLEHLQDANKECFDGVMQSIIGNDYDSNKVYILWGCVNSGSGLNYVISAGQVFKNNEIYNVPATTFTSPSGEVAILNLDLSYTTGTNYDPVEFTDGTTANVHRDYIAIIESGATGTGVSDYSDCIRVNQHQQTSVTTATGYKNGTGTGIHVTRNQQQQVTIEGSIQVDGVSVDMITAKIGTLPVNFRPLHILTIPCLSYDIPQSDPALLTIGTNGDMYIVSSNFSTYPTWKNNTNLFFNATYYIH